MKNVANSYTCFLFLIVGVAAIAFGQERPVETKQQTKQDQRMFDQQVHQHDQEGMLEDPAIANQVSNEQVLPDSNERNVESRELTLDDFRRSRFVPVPVPSQEMQFVPGTGYVAGHMEEITEPGMGALAPRLGLQTGGTFNGVSLLAGGIESQTTNPGENAFTSPTGIDAYAPAPDLLLGLDPFHTQTRSAGIESALERRSTITEPAPASSPWQNTFIESSNLTYANQIPSESVPFQRFGTLTGKSRCEFKIDPSAVHDRVELERLSREGCLTRSSALHAEERHKGLD